MILLDHVANLFVIFILCWVHVFISDAKLGHCEFFLINAVFLVILEHPIRVSVTFRSDTFSKSNFGQVRRRQLMCLSND